MAIKSAQTCSRAWECFGTSARGAPKGSPTKDSGLGWQRVGEDLTNALAEVVPSDVRDEAPNFIQEIPDALLKALSGAGAGPVQREAIEEEMSRAVGQVYEEAGETARSARGIFMEWGDDIEFDTHHEDNGDAAETVRDRREDTPHDGIDPEETARSAL